jgi:class 3 adenylate cyclase/SAM-dependent methyltransferase
MLRGLQEPAVEDRPFADEFGVYISGYAPLVTSDGRHIGLVGLDIEAGRIDEIKRDVLRLTLLVSGLAAAFLVVLAVFVSRSVRRPLGAVVGGARDIAQGDLTTRIDLDRRDEFGVLGQNFNQMAEGLEEREFIRETFSRYMDEEVAERLLTQPEALAPGGDITEVTILMSDLRGFSVLTSRLGPEGIVQLLNDYLAAMTEVIHAQGGWINEFIGDAILCIFEAPDDAERAMRCALAMQLALDRFNRESDAYRDLDLAMGIGLERGRVLIGNIGGEQRVKYGVIGDAVNMAARIESLTIGGQILVSRGVLVQALDTFDVGEAMTVSVKGRAEALTVYELRGARDDPALRLPLLEDRPMREVVVEADLYALSGKSVVDRPTRARIVRLGDRSAELVLPAARTLKPLQDVKIRLRHRGELPAGWYAKVRTVSEDDAESGQKRCLVALTSEAEPALAERLRQRISRTLADSLERPETSSSKAEAAFLRQLEEGPITDAADRQVTTRILVEMAGADGVLKEAERRFIGQFVEASLQTIEDILAGDPLSAEELARVSQGPVRESMLMLAWATALCDADLAEEEVERLAELAEGLDISEERAVELRGSAQLFLAEAAFSIVWPEVDEAPGRPEAAAEPATTPTEADALADLSEEYSELLELWVPRYRELLWATLHHLPPHLEPARILELGCGVGNLSQRLLRRYPGAELHLADRSEEMIRRCRRRLHGDNLTFYEGPLTDLAFDPERFDLVVSTIALHQLAEDDRRALFRQVCGWIRPGGCFSYGDIAVAESPDLRERDLEEWRRAGQVLGFGERDAAKAAERVAPLGTQLDWLEAAGFEAVDCTWKQAIWTHLLAVKSHA